MRLLLAFACFSGIAFGCQESCFEYKLSSQRVVILDDNGKPLNGSRIRVRDADSKSAPRAHCGYKGAIVLESKTDRTGRIKVGHLAPGRYWISLLDDRRGESFLVSVEPSEKGAELKLKLRQIHGLCYLVDIERNVTIPPWGEKRPVHDN